MATGSAPECCGSGELGYLWVRGSVVALGYWDCSLAQNAALSAGAHQEDATRFVDAGDTRWLRTGDMAWRENDDVLHFAGRDGDLMLKVCGVKVFGESLREDILAMLEGSSASSDKCSSVPDDGASGQAAKRQRTADPEEEAMRNLRLLALRGAAARRPELLICSRRKLDPSCEMDEVVIFAAGAVSQNALRAAAQDALRKSVGFGTIAAPVPLRVLVMEGVPRLPNLKPDWQALARALQEHLCGAVENASHEDETELVGIVLDAARRLAEDQRLKEDDDLIEEWGFSSLLLGRLVTWLNDSLGGNLTLLHVLEHSIPDGKTRQPCSASAIASLFASFDDPASDNEEHVSDRTTTTKLVSSSHVAEAALELSASTVGHRSPTSCVWSVHFGKCVDAPILQLPPEAGSDEPLLVAGSVGGAVACIRGSGEVVWMRHIHDRCVAQCAALAGEHRRVLVPSWGGLIYCLHLLTGELEWLCNLGAKSRSNPVVSHGFIWAGTYAGELLQMDAVGEIVGRRLLHRSGVAAIGVASDLLVAVFLHGLILGLRPDSNSPPVWKTDLGCPAFRPPLVSSDSAVLFIGSVQGLVALRTGDGDVLWSRPGKEIYQPLIHLKHHSGSDGVLVADASGKVAAYTCQGDSLATPLTFQGVPASVAAASDGTAVICFRDAPGVVLVAIALMSRTIQGVAAGQREGSLDARCASPVMEASNTVGDDIAGNTSSEVVVESKLERVLTEIWRLPLSNLKGLPRGGTQCHSLQLLPGDRVVMGARDDFLHAIG
eukprot:TRINITY_DN6099_c0_g1_i1.p1 TRINITY_DN6099_c0_g1~~TRINITY_DN6099_c0_g1_i1.p1  ORF type:complete len:831 (+),score=124.57 TRINITY_DN6099_c0_g1_i1:169-2493(+)